MSDIHLETNFEHYITRKLTEQTGSNWQVSQNDAGFDPNTALYLPDFIAYLEATAPEKLEKMKKDSGKNWQSNLEKALVKKLEIDGTVQVLRNGFQMAGYQTIECSGHYPNDSRVEKSKKFYDANILRVMHQVHYQTAGNKSLDLVFFINGIPVATAEVKTELTQTVQDAVKEYQNERKPIEPDTKRKNYLLMFKRGAVVHFAISEDEIWMCTNLESAKPKFLPFNKGTSNGHAGNDPKADDSDEYPTGYFWNDVCKKENWLRIFHDFVFEKSEKQEDATGRMREVKTQLFPRFHQWDCVTKCIQDVRENGVGQRYLIEHSAGSGKTETISWTAHGLNNMRDAEGNRLFSSIIVVTDRVGLDANIKGTIKQLKKIPGLIEMIGGDADKKTSGSKNKQLAQALHDKREIIVVTLQTFPYALESIATDATLNGSNFAVLIDEAHSSQTGSFAGKMKAALKLASDAKKKETGTSDAEITDEDIINAYFEQEQSNRTMPQNVSFFAYTATPKSETKTLFGRPGSKIDDKSGTPLPESFHLYPMRQAIEEGYIIDVLRGYIPYQTAYKIKDDVVPDKMVDKREAMRTIAMWQSLHPTNVMQKTQFIIEHFTKNVAAMLGGQAKAMIVTSSRPAVIRYKYAIKAYLDAHPEYDRTQLAENLRFKVPGEPLVAFSGNVVGKDAITTEDDSIVDEFDYLKTSPFAAIRRDYDYTEENSNAIGYQSVPSAFNLPENRILIVCNKYQTGFNQKKLCAMYIDKPMSNDIEIVQTYSRANRIATGKDRVYIVDFVNKPDAVFRAFKKYDGGAEMEHTQNLDIIYDIKHQLDATDVYSASEFETYKSLRYKAAAALSSEKDKDDYRRKLYASVSSPAERWNNAMQAQQNAYKTWTQTHDNAVTLGNKELMDTAQAKIEEAQAEINSLLDFRRLLKKYCSAYSFIAQIVDLGEPDLEVFLGFAKLLLNRIQGTSVDEIDISSLVLSDYRINRMDVQNPNNTLISTLKPMRGGVSGIAPEKDSLKSIIQKINTAWGPDVSPVDGARAVNAIVDSVSADDVSRMQIRNSTNSKEAVIADGRLAAIIQVAAMGLKDNELGKLAEKLLTDPQAMKPIAELVYDLINDKGHLDIEQLSKYTKAGKLKDSRS